MTRALLITVRLHEGRYHGTGDQPPSPARVFQALVAGAGVGGPLTTPEKDALEWLEQRGAPVIASPRMWSGQAMRNYVPSNDLDTVSGDARRIGAIRTQKPTKPLLFDAGIPFMYAWSFEDNNESSLRAREVCSIAERLYQLGRGVDLAWAWGEVLENEETEARLLSYPGVVYRPSAGGTGTTLACPLHGSLKSLTDRYAARSQRLRAPAVGRQLISNPPKPRFRQVAYDSPPSRQVYELRRSADDTSFFVWPLARASSLVVALRDGAVARLGNALPDSSSEIERFMVGRKANGADEAPPFLRVRIVPLPSIGHHEADRGIRRVLVEVPSECPLRAEDLYWAFSGLELADEATGEVLDWTVIPSEDEHMLRYFGIGERTFHVWRTVTPVALPEAASRRRIDPAHVAEQPKSGIERAGEQARAASAVIQAIRFAGIRAWAETIRVQREPFEANGQRVEVFAPGTRFAKERLWHVEITFRDPITGPLLIADGRFLGLGLMAPVQA